MLSGKFKFLAPDFVKEETFKYLEYVKQKSGMGEDALNLLVTLVFQEVQTIPRGDYEAELKKAEEVYSNEKAPNGLKDCKDCERLKGLIALAD